MLLARPPAVRVIHGVLALFVLNAFLSMTNWWPTPFVQLDKRLAPEFVLAWVVILGIVQATGGLSRRGAGALATSWSCSKMR